jgi:hypothetical protein
MPRANTKMSLNPLESVLAFDAHAVIAVNLLDQSTQQLDATW